MQFSRRSALIARVVAVGASATMVALVACGNFSEDAPSTAPLDEAGVEGSVTADGAPVPACDPATVASDANHCGKCGHSCLGGTCMAGRCQPVLVGTSIGEEVIDVAVDAKRALWLTTSSGSWAGLGHVYYCPREGCAGAPPTSITGSTAFSTGSLAGDGKIAFFSHAYGPGQVSQVVASGAEQKLTAHAEAVRLQVRDGLLYYVTLYGGTAAPGMFDGTVYRWDGAREDPIAHFDGPTNISDFVVAGSRVFLSSTQSLVSCTIGACQKQTPFVLTAGTAEYASLTTDGTSVMWTDSASVLSCSVTQSTCATPAVLLGPPQLGATVRNVTFDHGKLYVSTASDIFACSPADCANSVEKIVHETRLFQGNGYSFGHTVAADDAAVYWSAIDGTETKDSDGGLDASGLTHRIMKLAR
jgi:hypothetical protein